MADRTSAEIFREIFCMLVDWTKNDTIKRKEAKELAKKFWRFSNCYDFSPEQMGCNDALMELDLADKIILEDGDYYYKYYED